MTIPAMALLSAAAIDELLDEVFGDREDAETLRQWAPLLALAGLAGASWVASQLSLSPILAAHDGELRRQVASRASSLAGVNAATRERIRRVLTEAVAREGASPAEVAKSVRVLFSKMRETRVNQIALMEAGGAWEFGTTREMTLQVIPARLWITQRDVRVRVLHVVLDGKCAKPDEVFQTPSGHAVRYPRDPEGEPEMVMGCRCFTAPLARGCESKAKHLATEAQRRAFWKATDAKLRLEERRFARAVWATMKNQRDRVLSALERRIR
jgi:hypothetical protein